jgi:hypothetical protein
MTMRFLSIHKARETNRPPSTELLGQMGKLVERGFTEGWLVATEGCLPSAFGARVRRSGPQVTTTDGPFIDATEVVGGFAIFETASKEGAVQLARDFLAVVGDAECEIRQLHSAPVTAGGD